MNNKILITGANGFVGCAFSDELEERGFRIFRGVRSSIVANQGIADFDSAMLEALQDSEVVIHLAARVHVMRDNASDPLEAFRAVNTAGTLNLAKQASQSGVRRFIFLSSIKVNGEQTVAAPFSEKDPPTPLDPYALSKWEAEQGLHEIAAKTGMEVVIVRSPLIYGPGVKANFYRLLNWVDKGVPLPLASVENYRSMIYLGNLVDVLITCIKHPGAAGRTYLVSDGEDISTPELIRYIAKAMDRPDRLWPLPPRLLKIFGRVSGKAAEVERLLSSLQIDASAIRNELGWTPPYSIEQGIAETVRWYNKQGRSMS